MNTTSRHRRHLLGVIAVLAGTLCLVACAADPDLADPPGGKADDTDEKFPTAGLRLISQINDQDALETLFHASEVSEQDTVDQVLAEMERQGATALEIKAEGIPVFTDRIPGVGFDGRLGSGLSGLARNIWSGKFFTFRLQPDGSLEVSLENAILGAEIIDAQVRISTLAEAMAARGEDAPKAARLEKFGIGGDDVAVDDARSVILDYEIESISLFSSLIDEMRPVTRETLAAAGVDAGDVDVEDLWIGRATALSGIFTKKREFFLYFALQFDADSIQVLESAE